MDDLPHAGFELSGAGTSIAQPAHLSADRPSVILSYGLGVESHAILERWIHEPASRPFDDWSQLIVVTAQVGEEHRSDTIPNVERRALPLMRRFGIRFVELARRGHLESDGIVVLQDTREPRTLHPDGVYKLSDELLVTGTVPQFGGEHKCAMKFKAFVIDTWLAWEFRKECERPVYHVFGYNAEESARINTSDVHIGRHNDDRRVEVVRTPIEVFGFNTEEIGRIERSKKYDGPTRTGLYPLQTWNWTRQQCWDYIFERSGIVWKKSHCSFCPFCSEAAKGLAAAVARWHAAPEQTAHGLIVEFNALCFNPRGQLYKNSSLMDVVKRHNVRPVLDEFERRLAGMRWGFYKVRRIYTAKGQAIRCVQRLAEGTRADIDAMFAEKVLADTGLKIGAQHGICYAMFQHRAPGLYPTAEGFFVAAPLFVEDKVRGPLEKFDARWASVITTGTLEEPVVVGADQPELPFDSVAA